MWNYLRYCAVGFIVLSGACSSNNGVDTSSNNGSVGGTGAGLNNSSNGGSANGTSNGGMGGTTSTAGNKAVGGGAATGGTAGTAGSPACGVGAVCTLTSCGDIVDACNATIPCGYSNCSAARCGNITPGECDPCTPITDCSNTGKCGPISNGCGGIVDCGACATGCCGCGSTGAPGVPSVCGGNVTAPPPSVATTCIAGSKGCLCDSTGACATGLACTAQTAPKPNLCCNGADCAGSSTSIGKSCPGTAAAGCTPGITIPTPTATTDNCGYVTNNNTGAYRENAFMCGIYATGGGSVPAQIQGYFNDEWPLALGCATTTYPVSAMTTATMGDLFYPKLGDPTCNDTYGRPMRPSLFITDITADPNCKAGDQQAGGTAYDPIGVFGTWTYADAAGTPVRQSSIPKNYWTLGTGADPLPASVSQQCPCTAQSCPGTGVNGKGYGAEVLYEAGLISGHSYRLQIMGHDGDQTQGGDSGEACAIFCAGTGVNTCTPMTCADYPAGTCGPQPDGCGGLTPNCGTCTCTPWTCEAVCASSGSACQTVNDGIKWVLPCPQANGCGGTQDCFCPIG